MNMSDTGNDRIRRTLIQEGTVFTGELEASCPITVMGTIEGDVTGPSMEVTENGVVSGHVKVTALSSRGELAGVVEAESVQLSGRVRERTVIRARSLEVKLSSEKAGIEMLFGNCELAIGVPPSNEAARSAALAGADTASTLASRLERAAAALAGPEPAGHGEPIPIPVNE
jgi:cytoskeletal protein CcmA (bactofilin family)